MIVTIAELYKIDYGKFSVRACNINNMEQLLGLFGGNVQSRASFIIQLCRLVWKGVHRKYFRDHPWEFDFRGRGKIFVKDTSMSWRTKTKSSVWTDSSMRSARA
ncbi:MAG: hypothetical protein DME72_01150 [Verrucomicrobia bacterium]|nr:MAG: hypothetical protein DME72_01150 [Verrucomicrobiota bacterium]